MPKTKREPIKKRNKTNFNRLTCKKDREEALDEVGRLLREGYSQNAVATMMSCTPQQIVYDVKQLKKRYREARTGDIRFLIDEKIEQLKDVRREAWAAWHRSKQDATKKVEEQGFPRKKKGEEDEGGAEQSMELLRQICTVEGRLPDNQYLQTILKTLESERQLLGLDEPTKNNATVTVFDWSSLVKRPVVVDPVAERIKVLSHQPRTEGTTEGTTDATAEPNLYDVPGGVPTEVPGAEDLSFLRTPQPDQGEVGDEDGG